MQDICTTNLELGFGRRTGAYFCAASSARVTSQGGFIMAISGLLVALERLSVPTLCKSWPTQHNIVHAGSRILSSLLAFREAAAGGGEGGALGAARLDRFVSPERRKPRKTGCGYGLRYWTMADGSRDPRIFFSRGDVGFADHGVDVPEAR